MKWFKREKKETVGYDQLAGRIANFIIRLQTRFADFMSRVTKNQSAVALKRILFAFFASGSLCSAYIVYCAFQKQKSVLIQFGHVNSPILPQKEHESNEHQITKAEYEQLRSFDHYMDSLKHAKSKIYDSILNCRPGLPDSVKLLESFYNNQFQNQK